VSSEVRDSPLIRKQLFSKNQEGRGSEVTRNGAYYA
jgi:hypothetical protein